MAYTNKGNIQRHLNVDIATAYDTQIDNWIAAVAAWIDRYCGKTFESGSETRYYDGNGTREQKFDDMSSVPTEVKILDSDGTDVATITEGHSNDYLVYPLNTSPKNTLRLVPSSTVSHFPKRTRSVQITAPFGFSTAIPVDIEQIATTLVSEIVSVGLKGGKLSSVQLGDYEAAFQKIDEKAGAFRIFQTLDMYRDLEL